MFVRWQFPLHSHNHAMDLLQVGILWYLYCNTLYSSSSNAHCCHGYCLYFTNVKGWMLRWFSVYPIQFPLALFKRAYLTTHSTAGNFTSVMVKDTQWELAIFLCLTANPHFFQIFFSQTLVQFQAPKWVVYKPIASDYIVQWAVWLEL